MKKHWLGLTALVLVTAGVSSGATAFYLSKQFEAREQAILANAKLQTRPVLLPIWIAKKVYNKITSLGIGGCGGPRGSAAGDEAAPCDKAGNGYGVKIGIPSAKASR